MSSGRRKRSLLAAVCRAALRLHPPSFRRRHGAEIIRTLEESLRDGYAPGPGGSRLWKYLWDTLATVPRTWANDLSTRVRRPPASRREVPQRQPGLAVVGHQVREAVRGLRGSPRYSIVVLTTLALGLGANTAIFSVTHAVLLRSLPYDAPERIARASPAPIGGRGPMGFGVHPDFLASPGVEAAALLLPNGGANLVEGDAASRVVLAQVERAFFDALGVAFELGGGMSPDPDAPPEVVLGHGLWARAFGRDPGVVGRSIELSGHPYRVAGVAPRGVSYPAGTELWASPPVRTEFFGSPVGPTAVVRLSPGAHPADLVPILEERRDQIYARAPPEIVPPPVEVQLIVEELTGSVRVPLMVLTGAAGALLLLGCLNLASIGLSRAADRLGALEVRHALGASKARVFGELLAEAGLLALAGGVFGIGVAVAGARALARALPPELPGIDAVSTSGPVLGFGLAATLTAAVLAGTLPAAWGASTGNHVGRARGVSANAGVMRWQTRLLGAQAALAVTLGVAAGLLAQSLDHLTSVQLGYDTAEVLGFQVHLPFERGDDFRRTYVLELTRDLASIDGVEAVGASSRLPFAPGFAEGTMLGSSPGEHVHEGALIRTSPGYFAALGVPLVRGRDFAETLPSSQSRREVILSASAARSLLGTLDAAGRSVWLPDDRDGTAEHTVRGVVGDVRLRGHQSTEDVVVYLDIRSAPAVAPGFAIRARGDPTTMRARVLEVVSARDPTIPPFRFETIAAMASRDLAGPRAAASMASLFGLAALLLVALGVYGTVGHWVTRRRLEIGIRVAVGAHANALVVRLVGRSLRPIAVGTLVGLTAAAGGSRLVRSLLYRVEPTDAITYIAVAGILLSVATFAAWQGTRRVARLDPARTLSGG